MFVNSTHYHKCLRNVDAHARQRREAETCACPDCLKLLATCTGIECYYALVAACPACREAVIRHHSNGIKGSNLFKSYEVHRCLEHGSWHEAWIHSWGSPRDEKMVNQPLPPNPNVYPGPHCPVYQPTNIGTTSGFSQSVGNGNHSDGSSSNPHSGMAGGSAPNPFGNVQQGVREPGFRPPSPVLQTNTGKASLFGAQPHPEDRSDNNNGMYKGQLPANSSQTGGFEPTAPGDGSFFGTRPYLEPKTASAHVGGQTHTNEPGLFGSIASGPRPGGRPRLKSQVQSSYNSTNIYTPASTYSDMGRQLPSNALFGNTNTANGGAQHQPQPPTGFGPQY